MVENLENEIWRDIRDYEGLYQVSNYARVKSLERRWLKGNYHQEFLLTPKIGKYIRVGLNKNGKQKWYSVHRLVAEAFIPNPNNLPCVNHKDENPHNNIPENLEWINYKGNTNYGTCIERRSSKLKKPIIQMDMEGNPIREWASAADVEREWNRSVSRNIRETCKGKHNSAYGSKWKYKEEDI